MNIGSHVPSGLQKSVWTDRDLDRLGFHDARVVAVASLDSREPGPSRFVMDLDYLVRWVAPEAPAKHFSFWICPATLVFDEVWSLAGELENIDLSIDDIARLESEARGGWRIEGHAFELRLITSAGFTLYMRRPPVFTDCQLLTLEERAGISFEEIGFGYERA
jgi:hypothetical protein